MQTAIRIRYEAVRLPVCWTVKDNATGFHAVMGSALNAEYAAHGLNAGSFEPREFTWYEYRPLQEAA